MGSAPRQVDLVSRRTLDHEGVRGRPPRARRTQLSTSEAQLRAASDTLVRNLDRMAALEAEKRTLLPDDPRLVTIANEVQDLASGILETATVQSDLVETGHVMAMTDSQGAPSRSIDATPRALHEILDEWRAAERDFAQAPSGSAEAVDALLRARGLRAEYQRSFEEARRGTASTERQP